MIDIYTQTHRVTERERGGGGEERRGEERRREEKRRKKQRHGHRNRPDRIASYLTVNGKCNSEEIHIHIHFIVSEKVCNLTIQTEEIQIQQEQAKAHRAYRRPVPKFNC